MKNKKIGLYGSLRVLTLSAMLAAVSVVIGIFCKNFFTFNVYYRVTFENLPVIFAGLIFGPFIGAVVGIVADAASCLLSTNPAINPLISLGAACVGFAAGAIPRWIIKRPGAIQTATAVATAHLFGQVAIKSLAKMIWFGMPWWGIFIGLGISVAVGILEYSALRYLLSRKNIVSQLEDIKR